MEKVERSFICDGCEKPSEPQDTAILRMALLTPEGIPRIVDVHYCEECSANKTIFHIAEVAQKRFRMGSDPKCNVSGHEIIGTVCAVCASNRR